jgi:hypothetical protein
MISNERIDDSNTFPTSWTVYFGIADLVYEFAKIEHFYDVIKNELFEPGRLGPYRREPRRTIIGISPNGMFHVLERQFRQYIGKVGIHVHSGGTPKMVFACECWDWSRYGLSLAVTNAGVILRIEHELEKEETRIDGTSRPKLTYFEFPAGGGVADVPSAVENGLSFQNTVQMGRGVPKGNGR